MPRPCRSQRKKLFLKTPRSIAPSNQISGHGVHYGLHANDYDVLIDAAHIKPFREFHDNSIRNGLAISPTLHRAFDNGLLTIDRDFHVRIGNLAEETAAQELFRLDGKKIMLPREERYWPDPERLGWHWQRWRFFE